MRYCPGYTSSFCGKKLRDRGKKTSFFNWAGEGKVGWMREGYQKTYQHLKQCRRKQIIKKP